MSVYVDELIFQWRGRLWCHMFADSEDELHKMACKIGLKASWFQPDLRLPHYDITEGRRRLAVIRHGAVEVNIRFTGQRVIDNLRKLNAKTKCKRQAAKSRR